MLDKLEDENYHPMYIKNYFMIMHEKCKTLSRDERQKVVNIEGLNEYLFESVRRYMGREDEDCDF